MTREEFKKVIIRYKEFLGKGKFLTDEKEYEMWYTVFKDKSYVVFNYACTCYIRKTITNKDQIPDLKTMIKNYNKARKKEVERMEIIRAFFLEAQAAWPKELLTKDDEDMFFYLVQTDDWDMCYRRAEFLRNAVVNFVPNAKKRQFVTWRPLAAQLWRFVEMYNEGIPRKQLGPESDDESVRRSRASYYWDLAHEQGLYKGHR